VIVIVIVIVIATVNVAVHVNVNTTVILVEYASRTLRSPRELILLGPTAPITSTVKVNVNNHARARRRCAFPRLAIGPAGPRFRAWPSG
jgi:hypothetical protein